jgi:hypothetical protein
MILEKQMEYRLARETEVLGENLPQRHLCPSQNPKNPGRRGGKPATNRLSYGAASLVALYNQYNHGCTNTFIHPCHQRRHHHHH